MCESCDVESFLEHPACQQVGLGMTGFRRSGLPHVVNDLASYFGGTYVIGPISQCLLDFLYFVHARLIHRLVQGSNMVQQRLHLCRQGGLLRAGRGARSRAVAGSGFPENQSPTCAIELSALSSPRQAAHSSLGLKGWPGGGLGLRCEAQHAAIEAVSSPDGSGKQTDGIFGVPRRINRRCTA
jgi:hypothetical protein